MIIQLSTQINVVGLIFSLLPSACVPFATELKPQRSTLHVFPPDQDVPLRRYLRDRYNLLRGMPSFQCLSLRLISILIAIFLVNLRSEESFHLRNLFVTDGDDGVFDAGLLPFSRLHEFAQPSSPRPQLPHGIPD